ncbi:MAG: DUF1194 domain-containing protein [Rhizobiaceae bacterium]|nr:DUF1194 domain-containing protein [Rhizobiaceae bacterium]
MRRLCHLVGTIIAVTTLVTGFVCAATAAEPVDVELVLAVDVSLSMSHDELDIQREGYAAALLDKAVLDAIAAGPHGKIAITYFEWAGTGSHQLVVPWTVISNREDAEAVVSMLTKYPPASARRTSISGALEFGADLIAESPFSSAKRVIDISGDGPNNQGAPVLEVRDRLVGQGIIINGLPLITNGGYSNAYDVSDLDTYYSNCVIGGPGAFVIPVNAWEQFPEAIRRKLVLELAFKQRHDLPLIRVQANQAYDCLIGEKMWRSRSWMWDSR